jgi:hypothetical protein
VRLNVCLRKSIPGSKYICYHCEKHIGEKYLTLPFTVN